MTWNDLSNKFGDDVELIRIYETQLIGDENLYDEYHKALLSNHDDYLLKNWYLQRLDSIGKRIEETRNIIETLKNKERQ